MRLYKLLQELWLCVCLSKTCWCLQWELILLLFLNILWSKFQCKIIGWQIKIAVFFWIFVFFFFISAFYYALLNYTEQKQHTINTPSQMWEKNKCKTLMLGDYRVHLLISCVNCLVILIFCINSFLLFSLFLLDAHLSIDKIYHKVEKVIYLFFCFALF